MTSLSCFWSFVEASSRPTVALALLFAPHPTCCLRYAPGKQQYHVGAVVVSRYRVFTHPASKLWKRPRFKARIDVKHGTPEAFCIRRSAQSRYCFDRQVDSIATDSTVVLFARPFVAPTGKRSRQSECTVRDGTVPCRTVPPYRTVRYRPPQQETKIQDQADLILT